MAVSAWFKKERKPRASQRARLEIPKDAWDKCESCGHVDIRERFERELNVCPNCGHHRRFLAEEYVELLSDAGSWRELNANLGPLDPLSFEHYADRSRVSQAKTGQLDAIYTGLCRIEKVPLHLGVMNFAFMGGSMGSVVGEKIARLARRSADKGVPMVLVCASGGARMQEGMLSLMQMAKTSAAIAGLKREGVPYLTVLTNPTTGGVSAAVIGFAGQRVIKQTIGQDLPEGFQTAEFLLERGQIDDVVPRGMLRETVARLLRHMLGHKAEAEVRSEA